MKLKNIYPFLCLALFIFSCGKDDSPKITPEEENKAPVILEQIFTVAEDITDTQTIGTVKATDPDGDSLTFSIEMDDDGLFDITSAGVLSLTAGKSLDFETKTEHTLFVSAYDGVEETNAKVTVNVQDVNETFVTTWKTTVDGESIAIGLVGGLTYDFMIDWGDGTIENITKDENIEHSYATAGDHVVAIQGNFPGIAMIGLPSALQLLSIDQWGNINWRRLAGAFADCKNMVYKATDVPDLSQVSSLFSMFLNAKQFNGDIGDWDVSTIGDMKAMFFGASSFNGDIGQWNTATVTDMSNMFDGATSFNQNIGGWNVINVTKMVSMFGGAALFDQDISAWNVSSVEDMSAMFAGADLFNQDISSWNVSNVESMFAMFIGAISFNQDLGSWNIGSVNDMLAMFDNSGMNFTSMNDTLIGWAGFVQENNVPADIICGMQGITICGAVANIAAGFLTIENGWELLGLNTQDLCP